MKEKSYFLDSYAIIEILRGNPNYNKFSGAIPFSTRINLVEVAYHLFKSFSKENALKILDSTKFTALEIQEGQVSKIAIFRKENSRKKFSYIDSIGYVLAKENRLRFVTGDKAFEGMPNVEFVK